MNTETWQATMKLRLVLPNVDLSCIGLGPSIRIQQAWQEQESGKIEWRDIETVRETDLKPK